MVEAAGTIIGGGRPKTGGMSAQRVQECSDADLNHIQTQIQQKRHEIDKLKAESNSQAVGGDPEQRIIQAKRGMNVAQLDVSDL